jgi:hypothetical protein
MNGTSYSSGESAPPSFFVAGVMQGSRRGAELAEQDYRQALRTRILERYPDALIHDPGQIMWRDMKHARDTVRSAHAELRATPTFLQRELCAPLRDLVGMFHRLVEMAALSDVCVAWLPGHEPSMGTAVEMSSAYRAGKIVVAITEMRQNLAVLACSSVIVPDIEAFSHWLANTRLNRAPVRNDWKRISEVGADG